MPPWRLSLTIGCRKTTAAARNPLPETVCWSGKTAFPIDVQRCGKRQVTYVVIRLIRGESLDEVLLEVAVEIRRLDPWQDKAMHGLHDVMHERNDGPVLAELGEANRHIGEISREKVLLRGITLKSRASSPNRGRGINHDDLPNIGRHYPGKVEKNGIVDQLRKTLEKQVIEDRRPAPGGPSDGVATLWTSRTTAGPENQWQNAR